MQAELLVIILNLSIVLITYLFVYPRFAGRNLNKLMLNDLFAMVVSLSIAGIIFSNTDTRFNLLIIETNWFWFALTTYFVIETPFAKRYIQKHRLFG